MNICKSWELCTKTLRFESGPVWMGILNLTPDSFSDGGRFFDAAGKLELDAAVNAGMKLAAEGAGIIDLGGESTRPGSDPVAPEIEIDRIVPVIAELKRQIDKAEDDSGIKNTVISVDTTKTDVARAAIEAGAEIVNAVSDITLDPEMLAVIRETGAGICLMHAQGIPKTMQDSPNYRNVVEEVYDFLEKKRMILIDSGISVAKIAIDPGIGFGKTAEHNIELLANIERLHEIGSPILLGHSRKRFIGENLGSLGFEFRDAGTIAISIAMAKRGVQIIRVHQVGPNAIAVAISGLLD